VNQVITYATAQRKAIHDNLPAIRDGDPDAIHDMRVAVRRLRSTLRTFRGLWDQRRSEALRDELKWLGNQLGRVRDGQVMSAALSGAVHSEPPELVAGPVAARLQRRLAGETLPAQEELREALDGERFRALLADLDTLLLRQPVDQPRRWVGKKAGRALTRAERLLDQAGRARPENRDAALHEARKAYKRGRYAVEVFQPGHKRARQLAKRLGELQDVLGAHHDTVVLRQLLREEGMRAYGEGENAFTYGLLYGRQHEAANRLLRKLPKVRRAVRKSAMRESGELRPASR
jgi:CHAD domain-containing protein